MSIDAAFGAVFGNQHGRPQSLIAEDLRRARAEASYGEFDFGLELLRGVRDKETRTGLAYTLAEAALDDGVVFEDEFPRTLAALGVLPRVEAVESDGIHLVEAFGDVPRSSTARFYCGGSAYSPRALPPGTWLNAGAARCRGCEAGIGCDADAADAQLAVLATTWRQEALANLIAILLTRRLTGEMLMQETRRAHDAGPQPALRALVCARAEAVAATLAPEGGATADDVRRAAVELVECAWSEAVYDMEQTQEKLRELLLGTDAQHEAHAGDPRGNRP